MLSTSLFLEVKKLLDLFVENILFVKYFEQNFQNNFHICILKKVENFNFIFFSIDYELLVENF